MYRLLLHADVAVKPTDLLAAKRRSDEDSNSFSISWRSWNEPLQLSVQFMWILTNVPGGGEGGCQDDRLAG